jgi:hypothetical protein
LLKKNFIFIFYQGEKMLNQTMLPIEITQRQSEVSSSIQVTYEIAWANSDASNQGGHRYAYCYENSGYNVSLFNLTISCRPGGEKP